MKEYGVLFFKKKKKKKKANYKFLAQFREGGGRLHDENTHLHAYACKQPRLFGWIFPILFRARCYYCQYCYSQFHHFIAYE
jgi:hypothetical protein